MEMTTEDRRALFPLWGHQGLWRQSHNSCGFSRTQPGVSWERKQGQIAEDSQWHVIIYTQNIYKHTPSPSSCHPSPGQQTEWTGLTGHLSVLESQEARHRRGNVPHPPWRWSLVTENKISLHTLSLKTQVQASQVQPSQSGSLRFVITVAEASTTQCCDRTGTNSRVTAAYSWRLW